jgi:hypothetical protein
MVVVRKNSSSKAVFAFDLAKVLEVKNIKSALKIVSKVCCKWNGTMYYDNKTANCQHCKFIIFNSFSSFYLD